METKIKIAAVLIAVVVVMPLAVFSDELQGVTNNTTAPGNNTTTVQGNGTVASDNGTSTTNTEGTTVSETQGTDSGSTVTTTEEPSTSTEDAWKSNPKIRVNPAGHLDKNSPANRNGTVVS